MSFYLNLMKTNKVIHTDSDKGKEHQKLMESKSMLTYGVNKLS